MEDSLHNSGAPGGFGNSLSTKNLILVISGAFLFVALLSGVYLSTQTQNIAPKAQVPSSCQGDDKYVSSECNPGDTPVGTIDTGLAGSGDGRPGTGTQLCCQRQSQPTAEPPKDIPPTDAPAPTDFPPTNKPDEPAPTDAPAPTEAPAPTDVPPTDAPACRQAPNFSVEIIINECPGCLGAIVN